MSEHEPATCQRLVTTMQCPKLVSLELALATLQAGKNLYTRTAVVQELSLTT